MSHRVAGSPFLKITRAGRDIVEWLAQTTIERSKREEPNECFKNLSNVINAIYRGIRDSFIDVYDTKNWKVDGIRILLHITASLHFPDK